LTSLKDKTISGLFWSFTDTFARLGIAFIVGVILARLLTPEEFGLIGMLTIFIALSQTFVNSGFSQALIRKKNCTDTDYSTVFYYNLGVSILFYSLLFIFSGAISRFFNEPMLQSLVRVLGLAVVFNAFTVIQRTQLVKRIDFKLQTRISVVAALTSGIIAIIMAYNGYGVWSLVMQQLTMFFFTSLLLWLWNRWTPLLVFSLKSFKELFSFGSKLLVSAIIATTFGNIYYLVIGRFFSATALGFYTRADQFKKMPSEILTQIISSVTYPVLSSFQDDLPRLKLNYQKLIKGTMLMTFVLMMGLAAVAEPLIITLIGEQWRQSIVYLQMLCFVGMMYPLHALNLNMLKVQGRSDLFLKLEVIKRILAIPVILIGVFIGIKAMIAGMIVNTFIAYYLNSYWSGRFINYSMLNQVRDILPSFLVAMASAAIVFGLGYLLPLGYPAKLAIQVMTGALLVFMFCETTRLDAYLSLKEIIITKIIALKNAR
jgi:teichuronic acid exporter